MDPIEGINVVKDSSFAMLLAAQKRGWTLHYMQQHDLFMEDATAKAKSCIVNVEDKPENWFSDGDMENLRSRMHGWVRSLARTGR